MVGAVGLVGALDLDRRVTDVEAVAEQVAYASQEGVTGTARGHDQMARQSHVGGA